MAAASLVDDAGPGPAPTAARASLLRAGRMAALVFALLMVGAAVVGGVRWYSVVPLGDAWEGLLSFRLLQQAGEPGIWWKQHNEHRILLARALFWLDYRLFGDRAIFLTVVNYLLVLAAVGLFAAMLRSILRRGEARSPTAEWLLTCGLAAWLFQWMQFENLTRPFQCQFFLATLVPLAALVFLCRSTTPAAPRRDFAIACVLGVASIGAMANGVLTLPLMVVYAALTRQGWPRIGMLAALSALCLAAYFTGYQSVPGHGSVSHALREQPLDVLHYWLAYLGGPFQRLFESRPQARALAVLMGGVFLLLSLAAAARALRRRDASAPELALLCFLLYVCASALATAGGRVNFGIDQVFHSSRYTTPALMAWAGLLLLYAPALVRALAPSPRLAAVLLLLIALPMLNAQRDALRPRGEMLELEASALALGLGVRDEPQVLRIHPAFESVRQMAAHAVAGGTSLYGHFPYARLREQLGQPAPARPAATCQGYIDAVETIDDEPGFVRITGWFYDPATRSVPRQARFVAADGRTVGFALSGGARPDVAKAVGRAGSGAGFRGYLLADQVAVPLRLQDSEGRCSLPLQLRLPLFQTAPAAINGTPPAEGQAGVAQLLPGGSWTGADFQRSAWPGWRVLGSWRQADADTGAVELKLRRGDRLLYRTGPGGGRQRLEIPGSGLKPAPLPVALEWAVLTLNGPELPEGEFVVRLVDDGHAWGEWAAIALKE